MSTSASRTRATAADLATWLPDDLLVKYDRMAMAVSLEGRAPFLAPALVEAALALPPVRWAGRCRRPERITTIKKSRNAFRLFLALC